MHVSPNSFNDCHAKTRVKIECVYDMWKSKFGILKCRNAYSPELMCKIIQACSYLWNLSLEVGDNVSYNPDDWQPFPMIGSMINNMQPCLAKLSEIM